LTDVKVCSPLEGIHLETLYEIISNPYQSSRTGKDDGHPALDFAFYNWRGLKSIDGHSVQAVLKGSVVGVGIDRLPYGNMVVIESQERDLPEAIRDALGLEADQSLYVLYAHLQESPTLAIGETVDCGERLGAAGKTGRSGAPHLHLEARYGQEGAIFSPMVFYDTQAREEEMDRYRLWAMSGMFVSVDPLQLFVPPNEQ
jgi:murein DD-endopeptidase MepM/ murein hydrolase activator NlpD